MHLARAIPVALAFLAVGCTGQQTDSLEDGLWKIFAGHPKPVIYRAAPPPVYCYGTIGEPTCYDQPRPGERLIQHPVR